MAATELTKRRSLASVLGVGSIALLGLTACDSNGTADDADTPGDTITEDTMNDDTTVDDNGVDDTTTP